VASAVAVTQQDDSGFGRLYATAAQADATPGALSGNGTSFTVNWQHPQIQTPTEPVMRVGGDREEWQR